MKANRMNRLRKWTENRKKVERRKQKTQADHIFTESSRWIPLLFPLVPGTERLITFDAQTQGAANAKRVWLVLQRSNRHVVSLLLLWNHSVCFLLSPKLLSCSVPAFPFAGSAHFKSFSLVVVSFVGSFVLWPPLLKAFRSFNTLCGDRVSLATASS